MNKFKNDNLDYFLAFTFCFEFIFFASLVYWSIGLLRFNSDFKNFQRLQLYSKQENIILSLLQKNSFNCMNLITQKAIEKPLDYVLPSFEQDYCTLYSKNEIEEVSINPLFDESNFENRILLSHIQVSKTVDKNKIVIDVYNRSAINEYLKVNKKVLNEVEKTKQRTEKEYQEKQLQEQSQAIQTEFQKFIESKGG